MRPSFCLGFLLLLPAAALGAQISGVVRVPLPRPVPEHVELGDIMLERGRHLVGRVVRSDRKSVVGLPLQVHSLVARSDKSGGFTLGPVPVDEDARVVLEENGTTLRQRVRPGQEGDVTLHFPPGSSRLDVRVLDVEGRPAAGVSVTAEGAWGSLSMSTDSSGHALLSVPPGPHEVRVKEGPKRQSARNQGVPLRFPTRKRLAGTR